MCAITRPPGIAIVLLAATALRAQTPPPMAPGPRATDLLARTKGGQESRVACDQLDESVGAALLHTAEQARGASLERLTVAFGLAEKAGRCAGSEFLVGEA